MNILYLSSVCSQSMFDNLSRKGLIKKLPQAQKYHTLMLEGLRNAVNGEIKVISSYPVIAKTNEYIFPEKHEILGGIEYIYLGFIQFPFVRQICLRLNAKKIISDYLSNHKNTYVICDVLNHSVAGAALSVCKKRRIPVCGIVTDVPGHSADARKKTYSFAKRIFTKVCALYANGDEKKYDSYLFLTENMNEVINSQKKPYIVIEGQSEAGMRSVENSIEKKEEPKVLMYAGGIHKEFGIERFVRAFCSLNKEDWILRIFGDGNYSDELKEIVKTQSNIEYCGVRPNKEIVEKQLRARLLVNPRLTDAEYVKYSFPSKTMECMASGTPLLTTKLPAMPQDYFEHVYFIDDESESGMKDALQEVLNISDHVLHEKGIKAKKFIIETRNNNIQARKFIDFLKTVKLR